MSLFVLHFFSPCVNTEERQMIIIIVEITLSHPLNSLSGQMLFWAIAVVVILALIKEDFYLYEELKQD